MPLEIKSMGMRDWAQVIVIGRSPRRTVLRIATVISLALIAFIISQFVLAPVQITGPSMLPTLKDRSINFINRLAYTHAEPKRGDIVAIRYSGLHMMLVKRIVGLPGELVGFHGGRFYVNGKPLDEPYLRLPCADWESEPKTLGANEYYVVGDNRSMPINNHYQGAAERQRIIGKVLFQGGS
jgi:signal peptidase I